MSAPVENAQPASITRLSTWSELNRQWLLSAIDRLRARLDAQLVPGANSAEAPADCVEATEAPGFTPALVHCACAFALSPFERELLLLVAGLELDHRLRSTIMELNGGLSARASYGLALAVLTQPHWDALSPRAPLRQWRMVEPETGAHLTQAALRIDERILHFLAGVAASDAALTSVATPVEPGIDTDAAELPLVERVADQLAAAGGGAPIVVLHGREQGATVRRDHAFAVGARLARTVLWIEASDLPTDPAALCLLATHLDRETALSGVLPVLAVEDADSEAARSLAGRLQGTLLWLGAVNPRLAALPRGKRILSFELPAPDTHPTGATLLARWRRTAPAGIREDAEIHTALECATIQFHLEPAALDSILERVLAAAPGNRAGAIWPAARAAARGGLETIAQRIETRATFDDVVLPAGPAATLHNIVRQLRQRERVYREWGFGARHQLGQGFVALFAGEPGTGKTLAAEAIANEAALDLYRIDLATVVSKYIGETEKNLKRLFDAAEASGAVLLFDEADALFGKRSEVRDSHDRYANIEVAYLLQRVEAYRGLAILTTNMKSALDRAFLRRIRFVITFPFPDAAAREQIWRRQFPAAAPVGAVDYAELARLNLAGGHIRSVAVNAAFRAAEQETLIDQPLLMTIAREEFAKLERNFSTTGGNRP